VLLIIFYVSFIYDHFTLLKKLNISSNKITLLEFDKAEDLNNACLEYLNLNNNQLKSLDIVCLNKFKNLEQLLLKGNSLTDSFDFKSLINESGGRNIKVSLEGNYFSPNKLKEHISNEKLSFEFNSVTDKGLVEELKMKEDEQEFKQIQNFEWPSIPMFSVLTGLNGIGKSSVLRFINEKIMSFYENSEIQDEKVKIQELKEQIITRDDIFSTSLKNANNICVPLTIYNEAQVLKSSSELELKIKVFG
jgi:hypothetical protein